MKKEKMKAFVKQFVDRSGIFSATCVGVFMLLFSIYTFAFSKEDKVPEEELKTIIAEYYHAMNFNKIETLPKYLSPTVCEWYGARGMSLNDIMKEARIHRARFPFSYSEVDWKSLKVIEMESGEYLATYEMIHRSKHNLNDKYQVYHLKLRTHWDKNFKLRAISETIISEKYLL